MPQFSKFLRNSNMFLESHRFVDMPVTICIKGTCSNFSVLFVKGDEIVRPCDRHSKETVTIRKHVIKYIHMRKWKVEFLRNFENRGIKIARVNAILITKSLNLQLFTYIFVRCWGSIVMSTSLN